MVNQSELEDIKCHFEALVTKMQTPEHAAAMEKLMSESASEIRAMLEVRHDAPDKQAVNRKGRV